MVLRPFDVGSGGNCFFRTVAHKLYNDPNLHPLVRSFGVEYLRLNPERFIEFHSDNSWLNYVNIMSLDGTWANSVIIQAVAGSLQM